MKRVFVYPSGRSILDKSGIGTARRNHIAAARHAGWDVASDPRSRFDVLHIDSWHLGSAVHVLRAIKRGVPIVVSVHNTREDFVDSVLGAGLLAPMFERWLTWLYSRADILLVPSELVTDRVRAMGVHSEARRVSGGFDDVVFRAFEAGRAEAFAGTRLDGVVPRHGNVVLGIGNTFRRKGFLDFVDAARFLPDVSFVWCGPVWRLLAGPRVSWALATRPANLVLAGYVDSITLARLMNASSVFTALAHEETEGLALLEALACGIPTVVRDLDAYQHDSGVEGVVTVAVDAPVLDIVAAVSDLMRSTSGIDRRHISASVQHRAMAQVGRRLTSAYADAIENRAGSLSQSLHAPGATLSP